MYQSPITLIAEQMRAEMNNKIENEIFKAVQNVGIYVDKDELLRALMHDRNQYLRGYNDRDAEIIRCKDCWQNNQCSIQFKFAYPDNPEEWFCAYGSREKEDDNSSEKNF